MQNQNDLGLGVVAFGAILIAIVWVIGYFGEQAFKNKIKEYLEQKKFAEIEIQRNFFGEDRNTFSFTVFYINEQGEKQENKCLIRTGLFADDTIYWEKPFQ